MVGLLKDNCGKTRFTVIFDGVTGGGDLLEQATQTVMIKNVNQVGHRHLVS